jgi:predicted nucleic acid-binding Zn ribbon protein
VDLKKHATIRKTIWSQRLKSAKFHQAGEMAKKIQQIESLGAVLDQSLKRLDLAQRLDEYGVWPIWNDVVGKTIARNAQPEKIRNGTLFVKVSSPVWMQQLQFMKEMIADKLNQRLHCEAVKNIFFMVGRISTAEAESATEAVQNSAQASAEIEVNEEFLASIGDPAIRAAFKKLLKSYTGRKPKT